MIQDFNKIEKVEGTLELPGDKSISHRSVMFASMAKGKSRIYNLSNGEDVKSSQKCFMQLGAEINNKNKFIEIKGRGFKEFIKPDAPLDAGNSGTTTRLISGILIAQDFESVITGDESLSQRPMKRIISPLTAMGGKITASEKFTLPLTISPSGWISPIYYELPVASAQVKSAVLLAGLHCKGTTSVFEKLPSRDHTEKMLGLSTKITDAGKFSYSSNSDYPESKEYFVPSDISTAAFFIVLTLLSKNSELIIKDVSLNETRTGILTILKQMGAKIETEDEKTIAGEAMGDVIVKSSNLKNIEVPAKLIPNIIDEIPVLAIAGIFAEGDFKLKHAAELRGKETDRIKAICHNLKMLGLKVEEVEDGFSFSGDIKNYLQVFESFGDHRIAMAFGILSLIMQGGGKVNNFECASISNPDFMNQLKQVCV
jgi:3-phosphoshikimate 1-carboxyvinyltransferase